MMGISDPWMNTNEAANNLFKEKQDEANKKAIISITEMVRTAQASETTKLRSELQAAREEIAFQKKAHNQAQQLLLEQGEELAAHQLALKEMKEALSIAMIGGDYLQSERKQLETVRDKQPSTEALDEFVQEQLRAIISQEVIEEREACAQVCENPFMLGLDAYGTARNLATAIRGRGK